MYCVVYEFKVKPDMDAEFEKSWAENTDAIMRVCGSLGSRLHKTGEASTYVAYAQWPSKEVFEKDVPLFLYTDKELKARDVMKLSLQETEKVYHLSVVDNRFKEKTYL